jgi:glycosyltransferase involved in cell wall biosynthesis
MKLRIAQISTVCTPVRRDHAGSVETVVWLLSRELTRLGHDVTVFGAAGSECDSKFIATLPGTYGDGGAPEDWNFCEWLNIARAVAMARDFDVVHCHSYLFGLPFIDLCPCPMLHTMHILPYDDDANLWRMYPSANVCTISNFQWSEFPDLKPTVCIPHGVDTSLFEFCADPEDYVCYLGRFIENKGPVEAIHAARKAGVKLILAGPRDDYYKLAVAPLVDGDQIVYVGAVDSAQRNALLRKARALLYPLREPEPFGLVQIEAMLCGTPIVAPAIGAIPEIVTDGVSGAICRSLDELQEGIRRVAKLDRLAICELARTRFSSQRMAQNHLAAYQSILSGEGSS